MKIKDANLILERLNEGQNIFANENPELLASLKNMELVKVFNHKVLLTDKGSLAAGMGLEDYIRYNETEKELLDFSREESLKKSKILLLAFLLLFLTFFVSIISNLPFLNIF